MQLSEVAYGADFYALWSAGHIALTGGNAYDQLLLRQSLAELGVSFNDPIIGNMPWTLWVFIILGIMPFRAAWILWECAILCSLLFFIRASARLISSSTGLTKQVLFPVLFTSLSFAPLLNNLRWGQSNFLPALGIAGYLLYESRGKNKQGGVCLSLLMWKPNLQLPLFGFLLARSFKCRDTRTVLLSCGMSIAVQLGLSYLLSPESVLSYPQELLRSFGEVTVYRMPSLSLLLANTLGLPWLRQLVPLAGLVLGCFAAMRFRNPGLEAYFLLINLGLITTPYCWSHSFLLLYPVYLYVFNVFYRTSHLTTAVIFGLAGFAQYAATYAGPGDPYMLFLPLALLIALITLANRSDLSNGSRAL